MHKYCQVTTKEYDHDYESVKNDDKHRNLANTNINEKKLYFKGLSEGTSVENLRNYFEHYGLVDHAVIMHHRDTGICERYGYVVFGSVDSVEKTLSSTEHMINSHKIYVTKAIPRQEKFIVSGLTPQLSNKDIVTYFYKFINVIRFERPAGTKYCLITCEKDHEVADLLKTVSHKICGTVVEIGPAVAPKVFAANSANSASSGGITPGVSINYDNNLVDDGGSSSPISTILVKLILDGLLFLSDKVAEQIVISFCNML